MRRGRRHVGVDAAPPPAAVRALRRSERLVPDARVLLVCGGGDQVWESCPNAKAIVDRRAGLPTTLLEYPVAGHGIANLEPDLAYSFEDEFAGFAPGDNARARIDAWPKLLRFISG